MRPPELKRAQKKILKTAAKLANIPAREEFLTTDGTTPLALRLQATSATTLRNLRRSWSPLLPWDSPSGFGLRVRPDQAALLASFGVHERLVEIAEDAIHDAILQNQKIFVQTLMTDLFSGDSFYQPSIDKRSSISRAITKLTHR